MKPRRPGTPPTIARIIAAVLKPTVHVRTFFDLLANSKPGLADPIRYLRRSA